MTHDEAMNALDMGEYIKKGSWPWIVFLFSKQSDFWQQAKSFIVDQSHPYYSYDSNGNIMAAISNNIDQEYTDWELYTGEIPDLSKK